MSKIFPGSLSTFSVTRHRHSGQRSSCLVATIAFKQPLQNVCWQGRTLHVSFNRSKQTEQSRISPSCTVSMMLAPYETEYFFPTIKLSLSFLCPVRAFPVNHCLVGVTSMSQNATNFVLITKLEER